jgi:phosphoglycolate phosphatase-like HAD superfamily hydrolase
MTVLQLLKKSRLVFWDFDGVIKDSIEVKARAFEHLFKEYGEDVIRKVRLHHEDNGGISRLIKIPFYYSEYVGEHIDKEETCRLARKFSDLVVDKVVNSPWIPGVEKLLRDNPFQQEFVLVTGTPQLEMEVILHRLEMDNLFTAIYGAPEEKVNSVKLELEKQNHDLNSVFIGDSYTDYEAAHVNGVPFILLDNGNLKNHGMTPDCIIKNFESFI